MVPEDHHVLDVLRTRVGFQHQLTYGTVMVQAGQAGYVLLWNRWVEMAQNIRVGVSGVSDDYASYVWLC